MDFSMVSWKATGHVLQKFEASIVQILPGNGPEFRVDNETYIDTVSRGGGRSRQGRVPGSAGPHARGRAPPWLRRAAAHLHHAALRLQLAHVALRLARTLETRLLARRRHGLALGPRAQDTHGRLSRGRRDRHRLHRGTATATPPPQARTTPTSSSRDRLQLKLPSLAQQHTGPSHHRHRPHRRPHHRPEWHWWRHGHNNRQ